MSIVSEGFLLTKGAGEGKGAGGCKSQLAFTSSQQSISKRRLFMLDSIV
jgi:hypothetical protein